jgi:deazaflavin-dependent oxidoreductase (nitroreductase family)
MGLAADLGYRHRPANAAQRGVQALGSSRAGAWLFSRTVRHLDDAVTRVSRGRRSARSPGAGRPAGPRPHHHRAQVRPAAHQPPHLDPGRQDLAVLGTNFGQPATPAWVLNLEADPRATVTYRGRTLPVTARPATDAERAAVMERSRGVYGGYEKYQQRISSRRVRVFVLEVAG